MPRVFKSVPLNLRLDDDFAEKPFAGEKLVIGFCCLVKCVFGTDGGLDLALAHPVDPLLKLSLGPLEEDVAQVNFGVITGGGATADRGSAEFQQGQSGVEMGFADMVKGNIDARNAASRRCC